MILNSNEIAIRDAARLIAVRCRRVIQAVLRDEEVADAEAEFRRIAEEIIRRKGPFLSNSQRGNAVPPAT